MCGGTVVAFGAGDGDEAACPMGRCCSWDIWGWGWVLLGPTGRRSPGTAQNPGCSWELRGWGMGLGAPGLDGQALPGTAQNPARLVYGSAALVASLRGQQSHFATLPISDFLGRNGNSRIRRPKCATVAHARMHACMHARTHARRETELFAIDNPLLLYSIPY